MHLKRRRKAVEVPKIGFIGGLADLPVFAQQQLGTMNSQIVGQTRGHVPQIVEQIVEAPRIIPQEFILQRAAVEDIMEVSPRGENNECADFCGKLAPKKRKSTFESGMMVGEA